MSEFACSTLGLDKRKKDIKAKADIEMKFTRCGTQINSIVGLRGLGVTCSPRDPGFAGSNPAEVEGFSSERKNPEHNSSGRDFKLEVPSLRFQAR